MKLMSESLDTVGVIARSVADCALLTEAVTGLSFGDVAGGSSAPAPDRESAIRHFGIGATPRLEALFDTVIAVATKAGASIRDAELPATFAPLEPAHGICDERRKCSCAGMGDDRPSRSSSARCYASAWSGAWLSQQPHLSTARSDTTPYLHRCIR